MKPCARCRDATMDGICIPMQLAGRSFPDFMIPLCEHCAKVLSSYSEKQRKEFLKRYLLGTFETALEASLTISP